MKILKVGFYNTLNSFVEPGLLGLLLAITLTNKCSDKSKYINHSYSSVVFLFLQIILFFIYLFLYNLIQLVTKLWLRV